MRDGNHTFKRRVVFQKSNVIDPIILSPRNMIVQWEAPSVVLIKEIKYLGVITAFPAENVAKYGESLKLSRELTQFVLDIVSPECLILATDYRYNKLSELNGDVYALNLGDLNANGLVLYVPNKTWERVLSSILK